MTGIEFSELKSAIDLYATQYAATDKLWSYFSSVTLAVIGFSVASDRVSKSFIESSAVVLGYIVFCIGNFSALYLSQAQLIEFSNLAIPIANKYNVTLTTLKPISLDSIKYYYFSVAGSVCVGILFITYTRHTKNCSQPPQN